MRQQMLDSAMVIYNDGLPLATETNDELALLTIYLAQGICMDVQGQPQKAAEAFRRGTQICELRGFADGANKQRNRLFMAVSCKFCRDDWIRTSDPTPPRRIL